MSTDNTTTIQSSNGEIEIDPKYGKIIDSKTYPAGELPLAVVFNVIEWMCHYKTTKLDPSIDILDIGYWYWDADTCDVKYEPPCEEFRKAANKANIEHRKVTLSKLALITANHALRDAIETFLDEADDTSVIPISEATQNLRERYGRIRTRT